MWDDTLHCASIEHCTIACELIEVQEVKGEAFSISATPALIVVATRAAPSEEEVGHGPG